MGCIFVGVHNAELTQQAADLMNKYNQIADKIPEMVILQLGVQKIMPG